MNRTVDIALATYNGGRYLAAFLDSLVGLEFRDFRVVVSDDNSTDDTAGILGWYRDRLDLLATSSEKRPGVAANFGNALERTSAPYVALADQDDYWDRGKLGHLLAAMRALESRAGAGRPALVFSDLEVVDASLNRLEASFYGSYAKSRSARTLADFVGGNHIPGCAMLLNRAALELALPIPELAGLHDWWLALVVSAFGAIAHVPMPLVKYRQHGGNCFGAPPARAQFNPLRMPSYLKNPRARVDAVVDSARPHASLVRSNTAAFLERYSERLAGEQRRLLLDVLAENPLRRARALFSGKRADSLQFVLGTIAALGQVPSAQLARVDRL